MQLHARQEMLLRRQGPPSDSIRSRCASQPSSCACRNDLWSGCQFLGSAGPSFFTKPCTPAPEVTAATISAPLLPPES